MGRNKVGTVGTPVVGMQTAEAHDGGDDDWVRIDRYAFQSVHGYRVAIARVVDRWRYTAYHRPAAEAGSWSRGPVFDDPVEARAWCRRHQRGTA